jgi:hypothetical protein
MVSEIRTPECSPIECRFQMQQTVRKAHSKAPPNTPALGVPSSGSIFGYIKQRLLEVLSARKESCHGHAVPLKARQCCEKEYQGCENLAKLPFVVGKTMLHVAKL